MRLFSIIVCMVLSLAVNLSAGVVAWRNIKFSEESWNGEKLYNIEFYLDEAGSDGFYTGMLFGYDYDSRTLTFNVITADDTGSEWYFVSNGDEISKARLRSGAYTPFNQHGVPVSVPDTDFYLAVHSPLSNNYDPDVFGWIQFHQTPSGLDMGNNAAAYGALSLTAGSYNFVPVPEPSTWLLLMVGIFTLSRFHRNKFRAFVVILRSKPGIIG